MIGPWPCLGKRKGEAKVASSSITSDRLVGFQVRAGARVNNGFL